MAAERRLGSKVSGSLKEVAALAGVSVSTVSRALRDDKRISAGTRERVLVAARQLGYAPDRALSEVLTRAAKRRGQNTAHRVALLLDSDNAWWGKIGEELRAGMSDIAASLGYEISLIDHTATSPVLHGFDSLLITDYVKYWSRQFHRLSNFTGAMVAVEPHTISCKIDAVCGHHWLSMQYVLEEAYRRGYRYPGLALSWGTDRSGNFQWRASFDHWCRERDFKSPPLFKHTGVHDGLTVGAFRKWINDFDVDVVISRKSVRNLVAACEFKGGVVNLGVRSASSATSGMLMNTSRLGYEALRLLDGKVRLREFGLPSRPILKLVPHEWHEGSSLPCK